MFSYFTVLSNWLTSYERYSRTFTKVNNPHSTYPTEFYLLTPDTYNIGVAKASKLLEKLAIVNDTLIRVDTTLTEADVTPNSRNGLGWVHPNPYVPVQKVAVLKDGNWVDCSIEELTSEAFSLKLKDLASWSELKPLTLSFLPVAMACQASCLFCFSSSSISVERKKRIKDFTTLPAWCAKALKAGAERFVITGGGEPTIIPFEELIEAYKISSKFFERNILITNGIFLAKEEPEEISRRLKALKDAGLSTLSLSYHHYDSVQRARIMGMDTKAERIFDVAKDMNKEDKPRLRIISVLQKGGVENSSDVQNFIDLALANNVEQLCFKELYVAATGESLYSKSKENLYSESHQIPLSVVTAYCESKGWPVVKRLPWGSPIYRVTQDDKIVDIAAYTEPSVGWERSNKISRSWNLMADAKCFASLEDSASELIGGFQDEL